MTELRYTPLRQRHDELGAAFTDFGGWAMPVRYSSDLAEHKAVRESAGIFDISHMAEFLITRARAADFLDYALAGKISAMKDGKAKYSLLLSGTGGVIDDVIVYRIADDRFLVISNAGNRDVVAAELAERSREFAAHVARAGTPSPGADFAAVGGVPLVQVEDVSDQFALIAVQGPRSREILEAVSDLVGVTPALPDLSYYAWSSASFRDAPILIARTGYTGEDGFELLVPNAEATALWDAVTEAGTPLGLVPAGLAARDTLRLEAGMPLHGHELSADILPAQAGLGRVVQTDKPDFVGRAALASIVATDTPVLVGLVSEGRRAGRAGYSVHESTDDSAAIGEITSGALSPTLGYPIAMAFVSPRFAAEGTELFIDVRGTRIPATVTKLPFYRRAT